MKHYENKRERYRLLEQYARRQLERLTELDIYQLVIPDRSEPVVEAAIDQAIRLTQQLREVLETIADQSALLHAVYSVPSKADAYEQARERFPKHPPYMMREYRQLLAQLQQELDIDTVVEQLLSDSENDTDNDTDNDEDTNEH